jgi:hypothetical protein
MSSTSNTESNHPLLVKFYTAYVEWVDTGAPPNHHSFMPAHDLELALYYYLLGHNLEEEYESLLGIMQKQFHEDGLDGWHPFNADFAEAYSEYACKTVPFQFQTD